jgi:hypothetical protein
VEHDPHRGSRVLPLHATLQQTDPTQNPVWHVVPLLQAWPFADWKAAVDVDAPVTVNEHVDAGETVPGQDVQPWSTPELLAEATSVRGVPEATETAHVDPLAPQLMVTPAVLERMLPVLTGPATETETMYWISVKFAVTLSPDVPIVTMHAPVPLHSPDGVLAPHANKEPVVTVGVKVTTVFAGIVAEQLGGHARLPPPAHVAAILPAPLPPSVMLKLELMSAKEAVTVFAAESDDTVHIVPLVELQPVHPAKVESPPGIAVTMRVEPLSKLLTQLPVQLYPEPVTVPCPDTATVSGYCFNVNVAVTVVGAPIELTLHTFPVIEEQLPVHPVKV